MLTAFVSIRQPLYGLLQAKLQLITHAYFEEKDFSQISILQVGAAPVCVFVRLFFCNVSLLYRHVR